MKRKGSLSLSTQEIGKAKSLAAQGRSTRSIARSLHRSPHTIARLLEKPAVAAEISVKKLELSDLYERRAYECVEAATGEKVKDASLQQLAISSGVFLDKCRLIRGESTDNLSVQVLMDICAMIRRDRDDDDIPRRTITVPSVPQPDPETTLPIGAGYLNSSPPAVAPQPAKTRQLDVPTVRYVPVSNEPHPDHVQKSVLMHGLRGE